ncbi:general secretion pathway protein GspL [Pseudomonas syringae]|nr:general secretion pathway protein GspL [Pseudomonas syringae]MBD8788536.1 general secretion pathway protein GspL [Pseudomonas syringae]MBD8801594.1 general secretion pathway protein GspL [Pseudomonas syringae]MBD8811461.1 general secretion pathway protein GspL [Pseudomonas syringae]
MNRWLYFTPDGIGGRGAAWPVRYGTDGEVAGHGSLVEAGQWLDGQRVQVIVPMEVCSWLRSGPWPGRRPPSAQALAYAIEEQLGQDLEAVHIAMGPADAERRYAVLCMARSLLADILQALQQTGIDVDTVHADADLLPRDRCHGVWWAGRWLLGGALPARLALSEPALRTVQACLPDDMHWQGRGEVDVDVDAAVMGLFMAGRAGAIELRQGEFRPAQQRRYGAAWPAMALACLFCLSWGGLLVRSQHVEARADELYQQSVQRFRTLYPQQVPTVDLAAQLAALQDRPVDARGAMLRLLKLTDEVLGASDVQVQRVEFSAGQGWRLAISAGSFEVLEPLSERGRHSGLPVRLDSASKTRDGVQAVLIVPEQAP